MRKRILLIPSCREGNGTGHLKRMLNLYTVLSKTCHTRIYLPCSSPSEGYTAMLKGKVKQDALFAGIFPPDETFDFIVVDKRQTLRSEFRDWDERGILIGIDEGGEMRNHFPYLIDTLPTAAGETPPNISCPGFLDLPTYKFQKSNDYIPPARGFGAVLITFGGEDPAHLTEDTLQVLVSDLGIAFKDITVVQGPLFGSRNLRQGEVFLLKSPENLKDILYKYDTVFTSFGLTAYEAAAAGSRVILINPTPYHRELSQKGGFSEAGTGKVNKRKLRRLFHNPEKVRQPEVKGSGCFEKTLSEHILSLNPVKPAVCPVCGSRSETGKERFPGKSFFSCGSCGIEYLVSFKDKGNSYIKDYFFSEYEKQYGKSYLDDFPVIRRMAEKRLAIVSGIIPKGNLLDVGCAYGPFLLEARSAGYNPAGLELVAEAAEYTEKKHGIPVILSSFEEADIEVEYDIVTMWYVIEHFENLDEILKKLNKIVRDGGLFAFSTPNSSGITGKSRREVFFSNSPEDHYTVWNPVSAKKVLSMYGFKVLKIRSTGHHPERFGGVLQAERGVKRNIVNKISKVLKLGDTFEVYAVKTRSIFK